jgi:hypothetical protein
MNTLKKQYSRSTILILLAINWAAMIILTSYFMGENESSKAILWTLIIGFFLQMRFICDQLKRKKQH